MRLCAYTCTRVEQKLLLSGDVVVGFFREPYWNGILHTMDMFQNKCTLVYFSFSKCEQIICY